MNSSVGDAPKSMSLQQLMAREDLWIGSSKQFSTGNAFSSGHTLLDDQLLNGGWPLRRLIEVCQKGMQAEWQLFCPALLSLQGLTVLLNPPANPFCQSFIQSGVNLDAFVVIQTTNKSQFIASFIDLVRSNIGSVLGWQPKDAFTYTELRKCALASDHNDGLSILFRPSHAQQNSSPAGLRLFTQITQCGLAVSIFKQKGQLKAPLTKPIIVELPQQWGKQNTHATLEAEPFESISSIPPYSTAVTPPRGSA